MDPKALQLAKRRLKRNLVLVVVGFAVVLSSLVLYARVWPPMIGVDSNSMSHDPDVSAFGPIDTGDILLIQTVTFPGDIVTYVEGRRSGYATYGDFGDIVVFEDPERLSPARIVHRALAYVTWNLTACGACYDLPALADLPGSDWDAWDLRGFPTEIPRGITRFVIRGAGWAQDFDIAFFSSQILTRTSGAGLLTMGDWNVYDAPFQVDPWIVPLSEVHGVARGEIPWFALLQLTISPGPFGCCEAWGSVNRDYGAPANSWLGLEISLAVLIGTPVAASVMQSRIERRRKASKRQQGRGNQSDA